MALYLQMFRRLCYIPPPTWSSYRSLRLFITCFPVKDEIAKYVIVPDILYVVVELTPMFSGRYLDPKNEEGSA